MTTIGSMAVGSVVQVNLNSTPTEFQIIHQGLPSDLYDPSCNGTWLILKGIYNLQEWNSGNSFVKNNFKTLLDSRIHQYIKQVKIPYSTVDLYGKITNYSGDKGESTECFLLSLDETGAEKETSAILDGAKLDYFSTDYTRMAYYKNGDQNNAMSWWLRTPVKVNTSYKCCIESGGYSGGSANYYKYGIRPAFILLPETKVADDGNIVYNEPPSAPESLTISTIVAGDPAALTWTAAADPDGTVASYTLERSVNESDWEQIYTGPELTYTDTIGTGWGTVAYRVYATDDAGDNGPYVEIAPQTVQAGILYIAGPAANMGEKTVPFSFQVTVNVSGSGTVVNGIAVTIDFDGYSFYNGIVDAGQTLTFPMDPRAIGSGAHKLTVTASKQDYITVSETYAFSTPAIPFPDKGLGVQLQDEAARPIFPQTAAGLVEGLNGKTVGANLQEMYGKVIISDQDLEAGISPLEEGKIYLVYE